MYRFEHVPESRYRFISVFRFQLYSNCSKHILALRSFSRAEQAGNIARSCFKHAATIVLVDTTAVLRKTKCLA